MIMYISIIIYVYVHIYAYIHMYVYIIPIATELNLRQLRYCIDSGAEALHRPSPAGWYALPIGTSARALRNCLV